MSVVVVNQIEGGSEELYEKVNSKVMPGAELPDGCEAHIAGPVEGGWRVITVWESQDRFEEFRDGTLLPALRDAAEEGRIAPQISADPVYRFLKA